MCFGESQAESVKHCECCRRDSGVHTKHRLSYCTYLTTYPSKPGMCDAGIKSKVSLQNNALNLCSALSFKKNTFKYMHTSHLILKAIVGNS